MTQLRPFHLAIPVRDIAESREFYGDLSGLSEGRSSEEWVDWNFYGHQLVTHLNPNSGKDGKLDNHVNGVDGKGVPVPHFGVVLTAEDWADLSEKVTGKVDFIIEPYTRFQGEAGEQSTMFFTDPTGNVLCGEDDSLCPIERHELMHHLIPDSQLKIIKGAGHLPTLEQPEITTEALLEWMSRI